MLFLMIPIFIIIIVIIALASLVPVDAMGSNQAEGSIGNVISSISSSPFGSEETFDISVDSGITTSLKMKWGLGIGSIFIILSGILIIIAGVLEILANTMFFQTKIPYIKKGLFSRKPQPVTMMQQPPSAPQQMNQTVPPPPVPQPFVNEPAPVQSDNNDQVNSEVIFCTECGAKLGKDAAFCTECGKKIK